MGPRAARGEAGSTLVELLVTLVILGIAFVTLLGGMFTAVNSSDRHRKQTVADSALRSVAEAVKAAEYRDGCAGYGTEPVKAGFTATVLRCCPLPQPSTTTTNPLPAVAPTTVVTTVPLPTTTTTTPCTPLSGGAPQLVTLQVASDDGRATETVDVVKRDERPSTTTSTAGL